MNKIIVALFFFISSFSPAMEIPTLGKQSLEQIFEPELSKKARKDAPTITLVSAEGEEFKVPKDVALQAEQVKALLTAPSGEIATNKIEFKSISSAVMGQLAKLMVFIHEHPHLNGKILLDALGKEVPLQEGWDTWPISLIKKETPTALTFLKAADLLDFKPAISLAVRNLLEDQATRTWAINLTRLNRISSTVKAEIARFHFLKIGSKLEGFPEQDYGFSIQDYFDYRPDVLKEKLKTVWSGITAEFAHLRLNNINGLSKTTSPSSSIPAMQTLLLSMTDDLFTGDYNHQPNKDLFKKENIKLINFLQLEDNQITSISPGSFSAFQGLKLIDLRNNQITRIDDPNTFGSLPKLTHLIIQKNPLIAANPAAFSALRDLQVLGLQGTQLSEENKAAMRKALPNVEVLFGY